MVPGFAGAVGGSLMPGSAARAAFAPASRLGTFKGKAMAPPGWPQAARAMLMRSTEP